MKKLRSFQLLGCVSVFLSHLFREQSSHKVLSVGLHCEEDVPFIFLFLGFPLGFFLFT